MGMLVWEGGKRWGERVATRRVLTGEDRSSRCSWRFASRLWVWDAEAVEEEGGGSCSRSASSVMIAIPPVDQVLNNLRPSRIQLEVQISHQRPTVGTADQEARCLGTENDFPLCLCRTSFGGVKL